jgi:hypothetical protein
MNSSYRMNAEWVAGSVESKVKTLAALLTNSS